MGHNILGFENVTNLDQVVRFRDLCRGADHEDQSGKQRPAEGDTGVVK